ncbi:hypothetical protein VN12_08070 [Pirellula sp. SH-Sr6A]|nr:hypothetical protein VN12_08070 [Pirellula sp. SH-Sr6A]
MELPYEPGWLSCLEGVFRPVAYSGWLGDCPTNLSQNLSQRCGFLLIGNLNKHTGLGQRCKCYPGDRLIFAIRLPFCIGLKTLYAVQLPFHRRSRHSTGHQPFSVELNLVWKTTG